MRNVSEYDLSRMFDAMVETVDEQASSDEQAAKILRAVAYQLVKLGWDETSLPSGALAQAIKKYEDKPYVVLALRLADPEAELLDSHTGARSWLGYDAWKNRWVLRLPDGSEETASPTIDGWNDLVIKWLRAMDSDEDYRGGYERYCI